MVACIPNCVKLMFVERQLQKLLDAQHINSVQHKSNEPKKNQKKSSFYKKTDALFPSLIYLLFSFVNGSSILLKNNLSHSFLNNVLNAH